MRTDSPRSSCGWRVAGLVFVMAAVSGLGGCLRIVRQQAPYYLDGPHQVEPPNGFLEPGTRVLTFGSKDSYSHVLTFDGIAADVWDGDLVSPSQWRKEQQARKATAAGSATPPGEPPHTSP